MLQLPNVQVKEKQRMYIHIELSITLQAFSPTYII